MYSEAQQVLQTPTFLAYMSLIDGLCTRECLEEAAKLFEEMVGNGISPDNVAYTSLMHGYLKRGKLEEIFILRDKMVESGLEELDLHSYTSLIWGLCSCENMKEARNLLSDMITNGVGPDEVVYSCLIRKC
ncbi:hypothetical protein KSP40_PGU002289 [Platanthera guangdongensis]|uniref:Pentatricopeptide repeat-containing protein n=1 Tax=Platanthera guangdongensis TaxID=2320717 RepID=A0ABR2LXS0_9ASPA